MSYLKIHNLYGIIDKIITRNNKMDHDKILNNIKRIAIS